MADDDNKPDDETDDDDKQDEGQEQPGQLDTRDFTEGAAGREVADQPVSTHDRKKRRDQPNLSADDKEGDPDEGAGGHYKAGEDVSPGNDEAPGLVIFDFDATLVEQDSLHMLAAEVVGDRIRAYLLFLLALCTCFWEAVTTKREYMDSLSAFKVHWMRWTLAGTPADEVKRIAEKMREELDWRDRLVADMKECASKGYHVIVATGALDLYMSVLLKGLPVTGIICAHAELDEGGRMTGRLRGPKEQCNPVRGEKRRRVQKYIHEQGPFSHIIGYGNLPHDGPFLALCDEMFII